MQKIRICAMLLVVSMMIGLVVTLPLSASAGFSDTQGHWANASINRWSDAGVILGDGNGTFRPDAPMTRAEFAVALDRVMQFKTKATNPFQDVPAGSWYEDAALRAYAADVLSGTDVSMMSPMDNVTREQCITLLGRALAMEENDSLQGYEDADLVSEYAKGFVGALSEAGYIQGSNGMLNPQANVTRAEVVTMLNNSITTWANQSGRSVMAQSKGITLVVAPNVIVTGTANDILTTPGVEGTLILRDARVNGKLTMHPATTALVLDGKSQLGELSVEDDFSLSLAKESKLGNLTVTGGKLTLNGTGTLSVLTLGKGVAASISKDVVITELVNHSGFDVIYGSTTIQDGETFDSSIATPTTPSTGGGGSSGSSGGGGGSNGGSTGGSGDNDVEDDKDNSGNTDVDNGKIEVTPDTTAEQLSAQIQKAGTNDIVVTLNQALYGEVKIKSESKKIEIKGTGELHNLTVDAPNADVILNVPVRGQLTIRAISDTSAHVRQPVTSLLMQGAGNLDLADTAQDTQIIVDTEQAVRLSGKATRVQVIDEKSKITVATTVAPTIHSLQGIAELNIETMQAVHLEGSGEIKILAMGSGLLSLGTNVTVGTMNVDIAGATISGAGTVKQMNATTNVTLKATVEKLTTTDGLQIFGNSKVGELVAQGSVTLDVPVEKVTMSETANAPTITANQPIDTIDTKTSLTVAGSSSVGGVHVNSSPEDGTVTIRASGSTIVAQLATTNDGVVESKQEGSASIPKDAVQKLKAPAIGDITITLPDTLENPMAKIVFAPGVYEADTFEYSVDHKSTWTILNDTNKDSGIPISADTTVYVRHATAGERVASEAIRQRIVKPIPVKTVLIMGKPFVGQTLTALVNADANGPIHYQWQSAKAIPGKTNEWEPAEPLDGETKATYTVREEDIGKRILVVVENYGVTQSETESAKPPMIAIADKTALATAITQADLVRETVAIGDTPAEFALGRKFVTKAEWETLENAKMSAMRATDDGTSSKQVNEQFAALNAAISAFRKAIRVGTKNDANDLAEALYARNQTAETLWKSTEVAENAMDVAFHKQWAPQKSKDAFREVIAETAKLYHVQAASNPVESTTIIPGVGVTAEQLIKAYNDLNTASTTFQALRKNGAPLDTSALLLAINRANAIADTALLATKAGDVPQGQQWVLQEDKDSYSKALAEAKSSLEETVQGKIQESLFTLNQATDIFQQAQKTGSKDVMPPVVSAVVVDRESNTVTFTSNEAGAYRYATRESTASTALVWSEWSNIEQSMATTIFLQNLKATKSYHFYLEVKDSPDPAKGNITSVQRVLPRNMTMAPVITITTEPTGPVGGITQGTAAQLNVVAKASNSATLTYQWYKANSLTDFSDTTPAKGINNTANYNTPTDLTVGEQYYYCKVSATGASAVYSRMATVNIKEVPPTCSCAIGDITFGIAPIVLGATEESKQVLLNANAAMMGHCPVSGHSAATIAFTYSVQGENTGASILGNTLTVTKAGSVTVLAKASAQVNGVVVASKMAQVTVLVSKEAPLTCSCAMGELTFGVSPIVLGATEESKQVSLYANTLMTGHCPVSGHSAATIAFTYSVQGENTGASILGNTLTLTKAGNVTLLAKASAKLNGVTLTSKTSQATVLVSRAAEGELVVTFDSMGGSYVPAQMTGFFGVIAKPVDPQKEGYIFGGWYQKDEFSDEPFNFATFLVSDITLYAKWI